jgi:hypothetical protein
MRVIAFFAAALALAGCQTLDDALAAPEQNVGPCPSVGVLYEASRLVEIKGEETYGNVGYTGEITGVDAFCVYSGADPIQVEMTLDLTFGRGPSATGNSQTYRYFVAVTRRDIAVIERQDFTVQVDFPPGVDRLARTETFESIVIPRANETVSGANFEIIVGFVLDEDQLAFNRAGKRFRSMVGSE